MQTNERSAEEVEPQHSAKPFLKWAGGKTQLLPALFARKPKHFERYLEPMLGGGAFFFALKPKQALLFDVNAELVNCYKAVQSKVTELMAALTKHRYESEYFYSIRNVDRTADFLQWSDVERAARTIYLNKCCYNGLYRVNSRGNFNVPFGKYSNPTILDPKNLSACSHALKGVEVACAPFESVLLHAKKGDFIYFDPPYVPLTKTASFANYSRDGFDLDDQVRLRDVCAELDKRGILFMLSNSYTDTILELYDKFRIDTVEAQRAINSKGLGRGKVREIIVRNYE